MCTQEGIPIERHTVTTDDGYLLGLYRIPANRSDAPAVLLMHGLFASGADYLTLGPRYSLAYVLAEAGFDVWLGNSRGTTFSRAHRTLDPDADDDFWNYSFHEIGRYDLPAMLDCIADERGADRTGGVHYVCHSQGCTAFFVLLSERPEFAGRLRTAQLMAPAVFMPDSQAVDGVVVRYLDQLERLSRRMHIAEVSPRRFELAAMCPTGSLLQMLCVNVYFTSFAANLPPLTKVTGAPTVRCCNGCAIIPCVCL